MSPSEALIIEINSPGLFQPCFQIWLWMVNSSVLWNMFSLEWPKKERKNQLSLRTKIHHFCCHQYIQNDKIVIFAVVKLSWSTVCRLAFKAKIKLLGLHTRCLKSVSGNFSIIFLFQLLSFFPGASCLKMWKFVRGVQEHGVQKLNVDKPWTTFQAEY